MAGYQYRFANYSFQTTAHGDAAQAAMDAMTADGWHVHTATANFVELSVLWERGGSASAERVKNHFEETGVLPVAIVSAPEDKPKAKPAARHSKAPEDE
jgi:hypothetical protein